MQEYGRLLVLSRKFWVTDKSSIFNMLSLYFRDLQRFGGNSWEIAPEPVNCHRAVIEPECRALLELDRLVLCLEVQAEKFRFNRCRLTLQNAHQGPSAAEEQSQQHGGQRQYSE